MEVAGQWRREWAGTAEYGKVTEGGVTRRVARAMEVLHASAPGARVRVMRAAYHSSSGPGVPASSYMLHSSRRVISSGFNILESPTSPSKPLEISSTPLESSPGSNIETANYEVTEPDDLDISEPSKWRGTTSGHSIRMPSEESSSTDNASIIDLDSRLHHKGIYRKYSYDSENSDVHTLRRSSARTSPLLDAPVTLSTLKYKSLLNNSNDWTNRRKSYSFEDTSPLNEIMVQSNDTLAMESSTDSGICKSSEIVDDYPEDSRDRQHNPQEFIGRDKRFNLHRDNSVNNSWNFKNKPSNFYKGPKIKSYKEHDVVIEEPLENNIALQSTGKLTITVPITVEGAEDDENNKINCNDDGDRKLKKVEFCKTELHFAADSGRVKIIATDEKPPPSNDFRKRRSAFVPIHDKFEKPITLFGERNDVNEKVRPDEYGIRDVGDTVEFDENTAATKSILKNKIPKPKPYLLGENMAFGDIQDTRGDPSFEHSVSMGVSLINKELESQRICHNEKTIQNFGNMAHEGFTDSLRTINKGPLKSASPNTNKQSPGEKYFSHAENKSYSDIIRQKLDAFHMSPVPKPKTRQLRESDLTFFGIDNNHGNTSHNKKHIEQITTRFTSNYVDDSFESVRLIKQMASSAQNSEAESDDLPDYQNIPLKTNFTPVPIPRSRVKYKKTEEEETFLKPILEQVYNSSKATPEPRRSRSRKQDEIPTINNRSRSEPAKNHKLENYTYKHKKQGIIAERNNQNIEDRPKIKTINDVKSRNYKNTAADDDDPLYANLEAKENKNDYNSNSGRKKIQGGVIKVKCDTNKIINEKKRSFSKSTEKDSAKVDRTQNNEKKINRVHRTEKLSTPEHTSRTHKIKEHSESHKTVSSMDGSVNNSYRQIRNRNSSSQPTTKNNELLNKVQEIKEAKTLKDEVNEQNEKIQPTKVRNMKKSEYSSRSLKSSDQNSSDYRVHLKESQPLKESYEKGTNTNNRRTSRKSEYVIKYDDKNGTVSSVSKVRSGHSSSRQKHSKDRNRENSKDTKTKSKHGEKSALRNAASRSSDCERKKRR